MVCILHKNVFHYFNFYHLYKTGERNWKEQRFVLLLIVTEVRSMGEHHGRKVSQRDMLTSWQPGTRSKKEDLKKNTTFKVCSLWSKSFSFLLLHSSNCKFINRIFHRQSYYFQDPVSFQLYHQLETELPTYNFIGTFHIQAMKFVLLRSLKLVREGSSLLVELWQIVNGGKGSMK